MDSTLNQFNAYLKTSLTLAKQYGKIDEYENLSKLIDSGRDKNLVLLICGEFKRGKSSLINAFLGDNVCPVADGIATAAVSIIKYGKTPKVTRFYSSLDESVENGGIAIKSEVIKIDSISQFAKGSSLDIDNTVYLEVEIPNNRLSDGLVLIDTPGIGSLDPRHLFLTQQSLSKADAFFFVTDTAEPMLTTELDFIRDKICPLNRPFNVILSKSDLVSSEELNSYQKDTESKISQYCGCAVSCIPVSSTEWEEYNRTSNERRKKNSNSEAILAAKDAFYVEKEKYIEVRFRGEFLRYLSAIQSEIEKSIKELSAPCNEVDKESYREQLEELKSLRDMIVSEDSEFRASINAIIEESQDRVFEQFSRESVLLSSDRLEDVLKDPKAQTEDGDKFVVGEINDSIQRIASEVDRSIDTAISEVVEELKDYIDSIQVAKKDNKSQVDGEITPIIHSFSESFVNVTRQALPFMGVATIGGGLASVGLGLGATILGITSVAAIPFLAVGIGVAAGVFYVVQSIKGTRRQERLNNIRRQISPRISIAMNEMRAYIQKRFTLFSKEVVKTLRAIAKSMTEQMQEKVKLLQDCEKDAQKKALTLKERQNHLNMVTSLITQAKVLNTNPFEKP